MSRFQPHGGTRVELRGRVLVFRPQTDLNEEEVRRLEQETGRHVQGLAGKRWAILGVIDEPVLLTPQAEKEARGNLPQMVAGGLAAQAMAFRHPADRPLIEAQIARINAGLVPLRFFDDVAEAEAWLNSVLGPE